MSKVYSDLNVLQAKQKAQADIRESGAKTGRKGGSISSDDRIPLALAFLLIIVLTVSVVWLSRSISAAQGSIRNVVAGVNALARQENNMEASLGEASKEIAALKDEGIRSQEILLAHGRQLESAGTLQKDLGSRIDKLESSMQAITDRLNNMENRARVSASPEEPSRKQ